MAILGFPTGVLAQIQGVDEWAEALVAGLTPHWGGPRVPHPMVTPRPADNGIYLSSTLESLRVHGNSPDDEERLLNVLHVVERARVALRAEGWGVPAEDGGLGGSTDFDLYLAPLAHDGYEARADGTLLWTYLDTESSYAVVDDSLRGRDLIGCATAAYVESLLLSLDPAEAKAWRRATAAYLTYHLTGIFGCREDDVFDGVARSYESAIPDAVRVEAGRDSAAAGYFVGLLDAQECGGDLSFIREMWQLARQRTWEGYDLRASPDMWMGINAVLEFQHRKLPDLIEDVSVARYLAGTPGAPNLGYQSLPHVEPDYLDEITFAQLPEHLPIPDPPVETFGTSFTILHAANLPTNQRIRVWLHGEFRVEWDLIVVPLDQAGHELTRVAAPPRRTPRSYLEVFLPARTDRVLIVVVNLSHRLPDADIADENARSFELIVDR